MKKTAVNIVFTLIPLVPSFLGLLHTLLNGGRQWSMTWNNEAAMWGMLLCPFAFIVMYNAIKNKRWSITVLPAVSITFVVAVLYKNGLGASSKSDAPYLELVAFWYQQWSYW